MRAATTNTQATDNREQKRKMRDAGAVLARKRFENIAKHSMYMRKWTGIINNAEKNKLCNMEKQMLKSQKIAESRIHRMKDQLKQELYDMESARRALRIHSVLQEKDKNKQRVKLERYAARGRYLYAIRNEMRIQKEDMETFSERTETVRKLLPNARRQNLNAISFGEQMGTANPEKYLRLGRKLSIWPVSNDTDYDSDEDEELDHLIGAVRVSNILTRHNTNKNHPNDKKDQIGSTPPPFNMQKLREELGPELRKQLDCLYIDDPSYNISIFSKEKRTPNRPNSSQDLPASPQAIPAVGHDLSDVPSTFVHTEVHAAEEKTQEKIGKSKFKLPPLQADKVIVKMTKQNQQVNRRKLSTVAEL